MVIVSLVLPCSCLYFVLYCCRLLVMLVIVPLHLGMDCGLARLSRTITLLVRPLIDWLSAHAHMDENSVRI